MLRIDDLDRDRIEKEYVQDIFDTLRFLDIPWQEGPKDLEDYEQHFSQIHRLPLYNALLKKLRDNGLVYACTCSRTQILRENPDGFYTGSCRHKKIPLDAENAAWRLNTSQPLSLTVKTLTGEIKEPLPADMQDFIVRKKDGYPAYQLSSLVDDLHFNIDLIVRGQDLYASTLAQLYLAQLSGETEFLNTVFYHHPLLTDEHQRKLSKSEGDRSINYLREQGIPSAEVYGMIGNQVGLKKTIGHWKDLQ